MAENSKIEGTENTFNPWWGCVKVSPGCQHCYAESFSRRVGKEIWGVDAPRWFLSENYWKGPVKWNRQAEAEGVRRRVFCASMADVFETHRNPETERSMDIARARLAEMIENTPALDWLLLTKRIESADKYFELMFGEAYAVGGDLPSNLWLGVTCESQRHYNERAPYLTQFDCIKFISVEPQLEYVSLAENIGAVSAIDWVICGGESGPKARVFLSDWARSLRDECADAGIAFFMKQLGGHPNKRDQLADLPEDLRIREFPG